MKAAKNMTGPHILSDESLDHSCAVMTLGGTIVSNTTLPATTVTLPAVRRTPVCKPGCRLPPDEVLRERIQAWIDRVCQDEVWNDELTCGGTDHDGCEACAAKPLTRCSVRPEKSVQE